MAVVGKNFAIMESGRMRLSGFVTFCAWALIHVMSLPQLQNRRRSGPNGYGHMSPGSAAHELFPRVLWVADDLAIQDVYLTPTID